MTPDGRVVVDHARERPWWQSAPHTAIYGVVIVLAIAGARRRFQQHRVTDLDALMLASVATLTFVSAVYFPTTRMRAPLDPMFMAYAACAFAARAHRRP